MKGEDEVDSIKSDERIGDEIYGRVFTIKTASCGLECAESQDVAVGLTAEAKGTFLTGKRYLVFDKTIVSQHKFKVPYEWAVGMRRRLAAIKVPAFPYMSMGCDGSFTELRAGGYEGSIKYRWWGGEPEGWEELDALAQSVIALFDGLCKLEEQYGKDSAELVRVCPVAGIGFAEGAGKAIEGMSVGDRVELIREKDNRHDDKAIAVMAGVRLG